MDLPKEGFMLFQMILVPTRWPEEAKEGSKRSFEVNGAHSVYGAGGRMELVLMDRGDLVYFSRQVLLTSAKTLFVKVRETRTLFGFHLLRWSSSATTENCFFYNEAPHSPFFYFCFYFIIFKD